MLRREGTEGLSRTDVRRARWELVGLAWRADRSAVVVVFLICGIEAILGPASYVATGIVVGNVTASLTDAAAGTGAAMVGVLVLAAVYVANQVLPSYAAVAESHLSAVLDARIKDDLLVLLASEPGIGHLEDTSVQDDVARAGGAGLFTPGAVVGGIAELWAVRLRMIGTALLVVSFRWWLAAGLVGLWLLIDTRARVLYAETARVVYGEAQELRRSDYAKKLAMGGAAKEVRVFGLADWLLEGFTSHWRAAMSHVWRTRWRAARYLTWAAPAVTLCTAGALLFVGDAALRGELGLGRLATVSSAILGLQRLVTYGVNRSRVDYGSVAFQAVRSLPARLAHVGGVTRGSIVPGGMPAKCIHFEHVAFRYPGRDTDVFTDLDLRIPAGTSVAVVGLNGAGKTTLVKLLCRCYEPTAGRITVDGIDLSEIDPPAWQRRVSAVFQDFVGVPLTAIDNVGFGDIDRIDDIDAIEEAARRAGVLDLVRRLPKGWHNELTKTFADGIELSGGEWQKLALARALFGFMGGAGLLILDEPSASLDARAEADLFERYLELTHGVTSVIVSHRFSTVRRADFIVVLEGGVILERGTHDELLARGERYAEMFRLQTERFSGAVAGAGG